MAAEIGADNPRRFSLLSASMRPRRMAAEMQIDAAPREGGLVASMRPRRMAAEIAVRREIRPGAPARFNEAAANGRGNSGTSGCRWSASRLQ